MSTLVVIDMDGWKRRRGPSGSGFKGLPGVETTLPKLGGVARGEAPPLSHKLDVSRGGYVELFREVRCDSEALERYLVVRIIALWPFDLLSGGLKLLSIAGRLRGKLLVFRLPRFRPSQ